ncbi:hypothetical protein [Pedobacter cryoconitis]|uniref:Glycosyl transferase family 2 n=1 Tax=Pedobacter cryoconitis TaxID=188932 RepID=A0A327SB48_9SPHI|nr:hypothetical protein [Pedobacter cryoconitis]RAJ25582.1 hypothetical protein LY11_04086 [Pedobacter cryoconitis]
MSVIKAGYLIAYDYEFVKNSLPRVYDHVSEIIFAVDIDRKTWSGVDFVIPDEFWDWVSAFDTGDKITIYQDNFYIPELSQINCDTRERNMLAEKMGQCDWYIQIDSDEYFVDFGAFVQKLENYKPTEPTTVKCTVAALYKQVSSGFLVVNKSTETLCFATNNPVYDMARDNTSGNKYVYWDDLVLHQSWARNPEEIKLKLRSWGHSPDFDIESYYNLWNAVDEFNCYCLRNFHPFTPEMWPELLAVKGTIDEILNSPEIRAVVSLPPVKKKGLLSRTWKQIRG